MLFVRESTKKSTEKLENVKPDMIVFATGDCTRRRFSREQLSDRNSVYAESVMLHVEFN